MHKYIAGGKKNGLLGDKKCNTSHTPKKEWTEKKTNCFKDDDWETHKGILRDIATFIPDGKIWDPFFCTGFVKKEWKQLGRECINEKKDAFAWEPDDYSCIVTNCPFTLKKETMKLAWATNKPFAIIMPWQTLQTQWIQKYWDDIQVLIPKKRYHFAKKNTVTKNQWQGTVWICRHMNLPEKFYLLK